jgi:hypothetical protein
MKSYYLDQVKEYYMGVTFGVHVEHTGFWWRNLKERSRMEKEGSCLEVIGIDARINLNITWNIAI